MKPFFSIIVPLFNGAATLPFLLDSIAMQRLRNFELIFMDGASTDNALALITAFEGSHRDIPVILCSGPDNGIYDAMNKGIEKACGEWLYFIGSDDRFCDAGVLQVIQKEIEKGPADLIYGNVEGMSSKTRYVYDSQAKVLSTGIHHQSVFYRHSLFRDLGKYDLAFATAADYDFTLKVFFKAIYKIKYINRDIACFGEDGFSAANFDYKFFSGHYRLLKCNNALGKIEDQAKCLSDSIYCCYYLASGKKDRATGWRNLLFYLSWVKPATLSFRTTTFLNMLKRTFRSPWML